MNNIYKPPESILQNETDKEFTPHVFWKVFFWIHVVLSPLVIFGFFMIEKSSIYDYVDLLSFPFIVAVLFGYVYSKKVGPRLFWKITCFLFPAWSIFYMVVAPFILRIPQLGEPVEFDGWLVIGPLFSIPICILLYLYSFKADHVWNP